MGPAREVGEGQECTSRPDDVVWGHSIQNLLGIRYILDIFQTGDQHVQLALAALAECKNLALVIGVAHDTGDIPGAVEEERREFEGNLAMATEKKDLHDGMRSLEAVVESVVVEGMYSACLC